jgi:hypothetical protein
MLPLHFDCEGESEHELQLAFVWSMNSLFLGEHPRCDHRGLAFPSGSRLQALAGTKMPFRAVCIGTLADWKWIVEAYHLKWYYRSKTICHLCHRCSAELGNVRELAEMRSDDEYLTSDEAARSPLCQLKGWSLQHLWPEPMHACALGVCQDLVASCLIDIIYEESIFGKLPSIPGGWKPKLQSMLNVAFESFEKFCREHNLQHHQPAFTRLGMDMHVFSRSFPRLKSKAHDTLQVQHWLCALLQSHDGAHQSLECRMRAATVWGLHTMLKVCRTAKDLNWLSDEELKIFLDGADMALYGYNALSKDAHERRGIARFAMKPKIHMILHLRQITAESKRNICSRWAFADEDNLQYLKRIGQSTHPAAVGRGLEKWALNFYLHFDQL